MKKIYTHLYHGLLVGVITLASMAVSTLAAQMSKTEPGLYIPIGAAIFASAESWLSSLKQKEEGSK